jgi:D-alanine-D-alanine ligase
MKRIAILTGGASSEREIALRSAKNVAAQLANRCEVKVFDLPSSLQDFLSRTKEFAAAIPVLHGVGGEDGTIQGFLETLGVPYLFSGVQAHAIAMDKDKTKTLVAAAGIRVPRSTIVRQGESVQYAHPVVVKPYDGGSSVATAIVRSQEALNHAVMQAFSFTDAVLIEDFVEGNEFTVAIADLDGTPQALPVIAIRPKSGFFDFESKYNAETLADEICPAPISEDLAAQLQSIALLAHCTLGCRQVSRTDIIVDAAGQGWFLEINTIPGMTETSLLPKALKAAGSTFADTLTAWIDEVTK